MFYAQCVGNYECVWRLCYAYPHSGVFITPIVGLCLNRFTSCCALTLGHFSASNRPSPYIFTKVVRVLVRYQRSHAVRITVYLDDGLGSARVFARCKAASLFVMNSLQRSGFLPNDSKSIWQPTFCLVWLGYCIDLAIHTIFIPLVRILSVHSYRLLIQFILSILLVPLVNWPSLSVKLSQLVSSLVISLVL